MKRILGKIKLLGIITIAGLSLVAGLYFSFQGNEVERNQRDTFLRGCFNQNYDYSYDNPAEVVRGCERLYEKNLDF